MSKACVTEGCEYEVSDRSKFDECTNCRAGWRNWMKRPVSHVLERQRKLGVYTQRMDGVIKDRKIKRK